MSEPRAFVPECLRERRQPEGLVSSDVIAVSIDDALVCDVLRRILCIKLSLLIFVRSFAPCFVAFCGFPFSGFAAARDRSD